MYMSKAITINNYIYNALMYFKVFTSNIKHTFKNKKNLNPILLHHHNHLLVIKLKKCSLSRIKEENKMKTKFTKS